MLYVISPSQTTVIRAKHVRRRNEFLLILHNQPDHQPGSEETDNGTYESAVYSPVQYSSDHVATLLYFGQRAGTGPSRWFPEHVNALSAAMILSFPVVSYKDTVLPVCQ